MSDSFKTISTTSTGIYKEKGSKFISFATPVNTSEEAIEIVKNYRKEYFDARHVCFAYMIGSERNDFRANDDGEPSGTAGRPILGQINSFELTNILIIVVRYFGGVLLGTGGLTTAYKEAALDAIREAEIIEKTVDIFLHFSFDYLVMNDVMRLIKNVTVQILEQNFDNLCEMKLNIPKQYAVEMIHQLNKIEGLKILD
ncbi:MAG: YigZ family protein [Paludibacter sp.]|nr:YigZ family protein [Paludibacter sp.]